jgi:hypothetical protein
MNLRAPAFLSGWLLAAAAGWLVCQPLPAQTPPPAAAAAAPAHQVQPVTPNAQLAPSAAGTPMAPAPEEDIRDIRGIVPVPSIWDTVLWILAGLAVLAAAVVGIVMLWTWTVTRRKAARIRPLHEIALAELEAARRFMSPEQAREFSIAVSEAVRRYIELRFGAHAPRKTTEEFLHSLVRENKAGLGEHSPLLEDFLRHCDLAKFARWTLSVPEMESMLASARSFIQSTTPTAMVAKAAATPPPLENHAAATH